MADLPERFLATMQEILGDEYESFLSEFDDRRHYGLRVNISKITKEEFERIAPFHLTPIPWTEDGYFYEKEDNPARHPFYAAGLYYLQEPSAMTPASRLIVNPGERVLDLCAAPGGKATALGAKLQGQGLLVANDINTARARALLRNIELFGFSNSFVTNEPPYVLAEKFPSYFDKIMVDAPCSGEGMFRKNPAVMEAWEEKGPEYFSALQREIIVHAADMLKPGGAMFYSTCTFSPLENEQTITHLLKERPEMKVIPMKDYEGFSEGLTSFGNLEFHPSCQMTRRIWPHHMSGEGHFLALLQKDGYGDIVEMSADYHGNLVDRNNGDFGRNLLNEMYIDSSIGGELSEAGTSTLSAKEEKRLKKAAKKAAKAMKNNKPGQGKGRGGKGGTGKGSANQNLSGSKDQKEVMMEFLSHLQGEMAAKIDFDHLEIRGDKVYYVPDISSQNENKGIHFLRNGVYLGDLKKNRFEPSEPCALILSGDSFDSCLNFAQDDPRLDAYLRGETLQVEDIVERKKEEGQSTANGWYLVLVDGYPLGFGKLAGNVLKNKYPVGWRKNL